MAFGKAQWEKHFGNVGVEPPLPANIHDILSNSCPYWHSKTVQETHLLMLIPQTIDRNPLTLTKLMKDLIRTPGEGGHTTDYSFCYEYQVEQEIGSQSASSSYWALITKYVLPFSGCKTYSEQ